MEDNMTILAINDYEKDLCKKLFDKNGKIKITDLALLSGTVIYNNVEYYIWTKTDDNDNGVVVLKVPFENNNWSHNTTEFNSYRRGVTILPTITSPDVFNDVISKNKNTDDYFEVEFGEYPQYVPNRKLQTRLLGALLHGEMSGTGKTYTFDSVIREDYPKPFNPKIYDKYEYEGRRFIYYESKNKYGKNVIYPGMRLKNGMEYDIFDKFFVEVLPVKWIVDKKHQRLVCKSCLLSGIPFTDTKEYDGIGTFSETSIKKYMEKYMFKDIMQNVDTYSLNSSISKVRSINGLNFDKVSEEDIIRGAIESGIAVFLHGRSSEGKSARVKQIDPTCERIYLCNATPESLNGKSVYKESTGEMIDIKPTWLKRLEEQCAKEPDKYHVVFFDELTNALPSIQGMAFNIVLDREVNGMWKLPENARIVAAGNDMDDSLAANKLAEPLFNRFAHVYIETTTEKWLEWATKNNIHPFIIAYIAYNRGSALRKAYNGETPNADPRKWEMASKMLYATKKPEMLRSLVGEKVTKEFVDFCKQKVITLEDVINDNYDEKDIKSLSSNAKHATIAGLSYVDKNNLDKVRKFTTKLGSDYAELFDSIWARGDVEILKKLKKLPLEQVPLSDYPKYNLENVELTLLSISDIDDAKIDTQDAIAKYGSLAAVTDLAILTGVYFDTDMACKVNDEDDLKSRAGSYFTKSALVEDKCANIDVDGSSSMDSTSIRDNAIRPVIESREIYNQVIQDAKEGYGGALIVKFGEYPQYAANKSLQSELEYSYRNGGLKKTEHYYTFDSTDLFSPDIPFIAVKYDEYEYLGKKYIRVEPILDKIYVNSFILSNGENCEKSEYVWVEVTPVEWLVNPARYSLISKNCLLAGVQLDVKGKDYPEPQIIEE